MFILTDSKRCTKCGEVKPLSEFPKDKRREIGVGSSCKVCGRGYWKAYSKENQEKLRTRVRDFQAANRDKLREYKRKYSASHPEKTKEYSKKYRTENPEKEKERHLKWRLANIEKAADTIRKWHVANPEKRAEINHKRRALKQAGGGKITAKEWRELKEHYGFTCLRCERREPEIKLTLDHIVPLSAGGINTIDNVQPLCKSCNSIKATKHIDYRKFL